MVTTTHICEMLLGVKLDITFLLKAKRVTNFLTQSQNKGSDINFIRKNEW